MCYFSQEPIVNHATSSAYTSEIQRAYAQTEPPLHFGEKSTNTKEIEQSIGDNSSPDEVIQVGEEQSIDAINDGNLVNLPEIGGTFIYNRDKVNNIIHDQKP